MTRSPRAPFGNPKLKKEKERAIGPLKDMKENSKHMTKFKEKLEKLHTYCCHVAQWESKAVARGNSRD